MSKYQIKKVKSQAGMLVLYQIKKMYQLSNKTLEFLSQPQKMLIGGEWVNAKSGKTIETSNPATGEILTTTPIADKSDIDDAVAAAQKAFETVWTQKINPAKRGRLMWKLADLMKRDLTILCELETLDNGKSLNDAKIDVLSSVAHFQYYAGWTTKIEGSTIPVNSPNQLVYTRREPLGVIGLITPWNFPLNMAAWKLAPALACGNCCIIKPAEQTPLTTLYLGKLAQEAGFPDGVINVVTGTGFPTGDAITRHMNIDKVGFTGSTAVGRKVMEAAAQSNLKKVSLELGGKSPNVIFADADLEKVMETTLWSSFYNSGQECTLGSRIYVQRPIYEQVVEILAKNAKTLKIGNGLENPDLGPMISERQMNTVLNYINIGKNEGAELVTGGTRLDGDLANGYFLPPTIFAHQNDELQIVQEEIFGPVVAVSPFDEFDEVLKRANNSKYGLAAAIWTKDISKAHRFAQQTKAGTIWINGYDLFNPAVPFGGYKESGFGREMGKSAIDLYTQEKAVWVNM